MSPQPSACDPITSSLHRIGRVDPSRAAIVDGDRTYDYDELASLVRGKSATWDLPPRSLVVVGGETTLELVSTYLALLDARHVPLLAGAHVDRLAAAWPGAAVARCDEEATTLVRAGAGAHELHPDLGLLLSTSGSTGSPKLVRLSHQNLTANAHSIAQLLGLRQDDRGITSLPLHYCYGLSVLHAHLVAGASLVLTRASVVDPCFRTAVMRHGVTNLAGVPHTFELLEQSRFHHLDLPRLRFMTQAGGRLAPDAVVRWADRLARRDAELFVMYGQTEATARMTFLPPALATSCPGAIGVPVPGGSITLRPHPASDDPEVGEIVYRGPNVMMGYAERPADLALGHELHELRTGDLARLRDEGVYEIVGRASRFVKPFGQRVDLDHVEASLAHLGVAAVTGDDSTLAVAVLSSSSRDEEAVQSAVIDLTGLPPRCVLVVTCERLPRTSSGKIDGPALRAMATAAHRTADPPSRPRSVAAVYSELLGHPHVSATDTFVSLGGDSLSYIECGLQLEELIATLPHDWHVRTVAELEQERTATARPRRLPRLDTTVLLRAVSICAVVATHMGLWRVPGGAHLLLAVVGYNFARFQLALDSNGARLRSGLRTAARVAIPASSWIGINMLVAGGYSLGALVLVNNYTGSPWRRDGRWEYWFFEVFLQVLVIASLTMVIPGVSRAERRMPFVFPLVLLVPLLAFRFEVWKLGDDYNYLFRTHTVAWLFVLGWAVRRATSAGRRVVVSAVAVTAVPHFFGRGQRELFVVGGLLLLTWLPSFPILRALHRPLSVVASSSMWIFLVHWQVWPVIDAPLKREVAFALTIAAGVVAWWLASRATSLVNRVVGEACSPARSRSIGHQDAREVVQRARLHVAGQP